MSVFTGSIQSLFAKFVYLIVKNIFSCFNTAFTSDTATNWLIFYPEIEFIQSFRRLKALISMRKSC